MIDDASVGGIQVKRIAKPLVIAGRLVTAERIVAGRRMILHVVRHRPNQRHLMHPLCHLGQQLADLDSRSTGCDRAIGAAHRFGCIGFHVERIKLTRPAPLKQERSPTWHEALIEVERSAASHQFGHRQPEHAGTANAQHRSSINGMEMS